jgi:hypothetical protein
MRSRLVLLLLAVLTTVTLGTDVSRADCTCRAFGRDFDLGHSACLATNSGPRLAVCGMVLNNTAWRFSDTPCVFSGGEAAPSGGQSVSAVARKSQHAAKPWRQGPGT